MISIETPNTSQSKIWVEQFVDSEIGKLNNFCLPILNKFPLNFIFDLSANEVDI